MITQDIYELAVQVGANLSERKLKLVTIESCTGGLLAGAITDVAGSSAYFERGFVTYSNEAKMELVAVDPAILQQYGAVSAEVATAMVVGGLQNSRAQVGMAITGIAGPEGGTLLKPVGTVYFAWKVLDGPVVVAHKVFFGTREEVRWQAVEFALHSLILTTPFLSFS